MPSTNWSQVLDLLDYAFQPIVNIHSGVCYGHECLMRNFNVAGFATPYALLDRAFSEQMLTFVEQSLRQKALEKFATIENCDKVRLFYNLDNRVLAMGPAVLNHTSRIAALHKIPNSSLVFEISERHQMPGPQESLDILKGYRAQQFKIAIDDFGTGFSGLQMLYSSDPEFIKIDRFFISEIGKDAKKKFFVSNIVNIAHQMGVGIIAEGVESIAEYHVCREIGCDLLQGYFVQKPTQDVKELQIRYEHIAGAKKQDRRRSPSDQHRLQEHLQDIPAIQIDTDMIEVMEFFRLNTDHGFFPVVNPKREPMGVITENRIKELAYSKYGKDLLRHKSRRKSLQGYLTRCPSVDIHTPAEKILEIFSQHAPREGLIVTENMKYEGFLSAHSLLKIINEKNLASARDQNPLSRLPGNNRIYEYVSETLTNDDENRILCYLDFDFFKPFNDRYGFRAGDRALLLFADLLRRELLPAGAFIGHIGGDDFFAGFTGSFETAYGLVSSVQNLFKRDVESFYEPQDRKNGFIESEDREGLKRKFPLLQVSCVLCEIPPHCCACTIDDLSQMLAELKKQAKVAPGRISSATFSCKPLVRVAPMHRVATTAIIHNLQPETAPMGVTPIIRF